MGKRKKKPILFVKKGEVKKAMLLKRLILILLSKQSHLEIAKSTNLPLNKISSLLQEFKNDFPKEVSHDLPPLKGIKHQIDLIPGVFLPDRTYCRSNPQDTKEIQRQVEDLMQISKCIL